MENPMQREEILDRLKALIHERFDVDPATLNGSTTQADIGIDSLLMVDMMLDVETDLGFTFQSMDLPKNPSLDTIVDLVQRNLERQG
jgi:acyl carrier protein